MSKANRIGGNIYEYLYRYTDSDSPAKSAPLSRDVPTPVNLDCWVFAFPQVLIGVEALLEELSICRKPDQKVKEFLKESDVTQSGLCWIHCCY